MLKFIGAISLGSVAMAAAPGGPPVQLSERRATIANSHEFNLASSNSKREFLIQVAAPVRALKPGEKAAVIYVLDGDYMFGMAADVARNLQIVREVEPVYVVGIGYPGDDHGEWVSGRLRDMLDEEREVRGYKAGGGGAAFRRFLLDELRPFIEARFPVDPKRSFFHGHSLGGLFGTTILAERPGAFAGYAIGSPSLWVRPELLGKLQQAAVSVGGKPRIYIGVGSDEREEDMVRWAARLADALVAKGYEIEHRAFEREGHVSVEGVLYANALKFLIPSPTEPVTP